MTPDLPALLAEPAWAAAVPAEAIPALLADVIAQEARLATVRSLLTTRLVLNGSPIANRIGPTEGTESLLDAEEAARRLGMSVGWLYKNAKRLPFTKRIGPRTVRFSSEGIRRYLTSTR